MAFDHTWRVASWAARRQLPVRTAANVAHDALTRYPLQNRVGGGKPKMRWYFGKEGWPTSDVLGWVAPGDALTPQPVPGHA